MQSRACLSRRIRPTLIVAFLIVLGASSPLSAELDDLEAEERIKRLSVSNLDPALPKEELSAWIARIAGRQSKIFWEVNDCGEQSGAAVDEGRDLPACVQASLFLADGREFGVLISVGTWQKGFLGKPALRQVYWAEGQQTHSLTRLGQIPSVIREGSPEPTAATSESPQAQQ
jgi:hypothetical protein